jgi:hypothetical protein
MDYIRRELGDEAKRYIIEKLQAGKTYSQRVVSNLKLESGLVHTFLPSGLSNDALLSFEHGAKGIEYLRTQRHMVDYINTYLAADKNNLVFFEDANHTKGNKWLSKGKSNLAYFGDHVYHTLFGWQGNPENIELQISGSACAWQNIAFLTSLPGDKTIHHDEEIDEETMTCLVDRTEVVISDAYDFDGYLFWELGQAAG